MELRRVLPPEVFRTRPKSLLYGAAQWLQISLGYWVIAHSNSTPVLWLAALFTGHALMCLTVVAHTVSHGGVIRNRRGRYVAELLLWTPPVVSTTAWVKLHNKIHHGRESTTRDVFLYRYFTRRERTPGSAAFVWLFHPNRYLPWNPLVLFTGIAVTWYPVLNALFGFPIPVSPENQSFYNFTGRERLKILMEVALIGLYQIALVWLVGPSKWIYAGVIPTFAGAAMGMVYIHTQHHTRPLLDQPDAIEGSTSVRVHPWLDFLHANFSLHIEHHIFPGTDSYYYPQVRVELKRLLGDEYHEVSVLEAYKLLYSNEPFREPKSNTHPAAVAHGGPTPASS